MLQALLQGKLSREQENLEDILTSEVFGLLQYVPPMDGIIQLFKTAIAVDGSFPFASLAGEADVRMTFWPTWVGTGRQTCEPDVFVMLELVDGTKYAICVEAKYWSGKSNCASTETETGDQLAKEWGQLRLIAARAHSIPILVYLTTHSTIPVNEINESVREYQRVRPNDDSPPKIYWLTWRILPTLFRSHPNAILRDIARLANRLNLKYFDGISHFESLPPLTWTFTAFQKRHWFRNIKIHTLVWGYVK